jgi:hypothetical protein
LFQELSFKLEFETILNCGVAQVSGLVFSTRDISTIVFQFLEYGLACKLYQSTSVVKLLKLLHISSLKVSLTLSICQFEFESIVSFNNNSGDIFSSKVIFEKLSRIFQEVSSIVQEINDIVSVGAVQDIQEILKVMILFVNQEFVKVQELVANQVKLQDNDSEKVNSISSAV